MAYELVLICVSISALARGADAVSPRVETALHIVCVLSCFTAFAVFYTLADDIIANGYVRNVAFII